MPEQTDILSLLSRKRHRDNEDPGVRCDTNTVSRSPTKTGVCHAVDCETTEPVSQSVLREVKYSRFRPKPEELYLT